MLTNMRLTSHIPAFHAWTDHLTAWLDRRTADMQIEKSLGALKIQDDPEAIFQEAWLLCDAGDYERGLAHLRRSVGKGYFVAPTLAGRPQFDALRADPGFQAILADAEAGRRRALAAFRAAGGDRLLGR